MTQPSLAAKWSSWTPYFHSILRIIAGFMLIPAGTMKLFAFPAGMPPDGSTAQFLTQIWIGGVLELVGGALLLVGLFTRPVAFILSGMLAVAYFQFHAPGGFWPTMNGGVPAVLYCFVLLYFSAAGSGPWSLDALRGERPVPIPASGLDKPIQGELELELLSKHQRRGGACPRPGGGKPLPYIKKSGINSDTR